MTHDEIEVGGSSIKETSDPGVTYLEALENNLSEIRRWEQSGREGWTRYNIPIREAQIEQERKHPVRAQFEQAIKIAIKALS